MAAKDHRNIMTGGDPNAPVRHRSSCPGPSIVPVQPQSHGPGDTQHQESVKRLSGSSHRPGALLEVQGFEVQGLLRGVGKNISGLHRTYCRMFRGSKEGGEWEGLR